MRSTERSHPDQSFETRYTAVAAKHIYSTKGSGAPRWAIFLGVVFFRNGRGLGRKAVARSAGGAPSPMCR
ncbi:MAG TPA: hypothetical protein DD416_13885 [Rhodobacteraceae bacterium]|nr:hypothetical protein [Paracoccaceae bacterium]